MLLTSILAVASGLYAFNYYRKKKQKPPTGTNLASSDNVEHKNIAASSLSLFSASSRQQQLKAISLPQDDLEAQTTEELLTRRLTLATANLGVASLSLISPSLIWLTVPGLIYGYIPCYQLTYKALFKERRISSYVLDTVLATGFLLGGYFAVAAVGNVFFALSQFLLNKSENNSKQNLVNLFGEQPRSAFVLVDGCEVQISFNQLKQGDIIIVSAGQIITVDGVIVNGFASIDQHKLTGESQPAEKGVGDLVLASTIVLAGQIHIQIEKTGPETVAMQMGDILIKTADFKNSIQSRGEGEAFADYLTLPTLGLSILFLPFFGTSGALAVLTNTFGYKMRIYAPASMLSFLNIASQHGILIKDGRSLDLLGRVDTVVFDKTGTLTFEALTVGRIYTCHGVSDNELLKHAAAAEEGQAHPIAKAILAAANERQISWPKMEDAKYEVGYGIKVNLSNRVIQVGSHKFMSISGIAIPAEMNEFQEECHKQGHSLIMVAFDNQVVGAIELHATIRPEAKQIINNLRERNLSIYIISGDYEPPTRKLAEILGIDHYFANTLPENKALLIEGLQKEGKSVCFVGDGINDSIGLKKANVSISLRGASMVATDTAQIVLMDGSLSQLVRWFDIAQHFDKNMKNNMLISTIPTAICLGGIVFFHWGVVAGLTLSAGSLLAGMRNTMSPLLNRQLTSALSQVNLRVN